MLWDERGDGGDLHGEVGAEVYGGEGREAYYPFEWAGGDTEDVSCCVVGEGGEVLLVLGGGDGVKVVGALVGGGSGSEELSAGL